jgi:hypothetical protein
LHLKSILPVTAKKNFLSELISRDLRGKYAEKSDQNSEKNFSVIAGLSDMNKMLGCMTIMLWGMIILLSSMIIM